MRVAPKVMEKLTRDGFQPRVSESGDMLEVILGGQAMPASEMIREVGNLRKIVGIDASQIEIEILNSGKENPSLFASFFIEDIQ